MDLSLIQDIYDRTKLFTVLDNKGNPSFSLFNPNYEYIVYNKHIAGPKRIVQNFIKKISPKTNMVDKSISSMRNKQYNEPHIKQELKNIENLKSELTIYNQFESLEDVDFATNISRKISKLNYFDPRPDTYLKLNNQPTIKDCVDALLKYKYFILPWNSRKLVYEYILEQPIQFIKSVLREYGISINNYTHGYDIIYFLNNYNCKIILNEEEAKFVSKLNINQLISIAGFSYYYFKGYSWGKQYLLIKILTGGLMKKMSVNVFKFNGNHLPTEGTNYKLAALNYYDQGYNEQLPSQYNYNVEMTQVLKKLLDTSVRNRYILYDEWQMEIPDNIEDPYDEYYYLFKNVKFYNNVFNRGDNYPPPNPIVGSRDELTYYTDQELTNNYNVNINWKNRNELINYIYTHYRYERPIWRMENKYCTNEDKNILDLEPRQSTIDDPIISYGKTFNYKCYNLSELQQSFQDDRFYIPDYQPGDENNEFSTDAIKDLLSLIYTHNLDNKFPDLITKIKKGLSVEKLIERELENIITTYRSFNNENKHQANVYLVWLFLFSMWMRFWKGPGNSYPFATKGENYCNPRERDDNVVLQLMVEDIILNNANKDVKEWISNLPLIKFSWRFKTSPKVKRAGTLQHLIDGVKRGLECEGFAGDNISTTAYSLITYLFNYNIDEFNEFINKYTRDVLAIEKDLLQKDIGISEKLKNERLSELDKDLIIQEPFDPDLMDYTQHV